MNDSAPTPNLPPPSLSLSRPQTGWCACPLDVLRLVAVGADMTTLVVRDGAGREYFRAPASPTVEFMVGGALGTHTAQQLAGDGRVLAELAFTVDARTDLDDAGGRFRELFGVLRKTMNCYHPTGEDTQRWRGQDYGMYVHWILDHFHTAKGMQYFSAATGGLVELLGAAQREDGMIWSFADSRTPAAGFFETRDGNRNVYTRRDDTMLFVRQPVENHCEGNFVGAMYLAWKGNGDDAWLARNLDAAVRALEYSVTDRNRWSEKHGLLKRGYTIDSWDFQVEDEYTVPFPIGTDMLVDPDRTKFGVFFGDNTAYAQACDELAEMLAATGRLEDAGRFRRRAGDIRSRLDALAWNGRFYTHRVEEDPSVRRDLGVDEAAQVAMSNAYSLNRGMTHEQAAAVLRTYQDLRAHAPEGSPGEWYAIYPPFGRGFGDHGTRWQYMNGGVHGHAAGELARGAFEHGFETYGVDILDRLLELSKSTDGLVHFAYTGAREPAPPAQQFTPLDLSAQANMDLTGEGAPGVPGWMDGAPDNDMRGLPTGEQVFAGVPYRITDPARHGRRAVVAVARRDKFPDTVEIPVGGRHAGAVYLVHCANGVGPSNVAGAVTLRYEDGTGHETYLISGKHLTGWWFPQLDHPDAGVAWAGPNPVSAAVGVSWTVLVNPHPERPIRSLVLTAAGENRPIYAVAAAILADRPPYHAPALVSHGGPDNWAGGTCMFALIEGLAGIRDAGTAFNRVRLSPRWAAADVNEVRVCARYPASNGYLAYTYRHDAGARTVEITATGSGERVDLRVLLPPGAGTPVEAVVNGNPAAVTSESVAESRYANLSLRVAGPTGIRLAYT